jgi:hypothetical protein
MPTVHENNSKSPFCLCVLLELELKHLLPLLPVLALATFLLSPKATFAFFYSKQRQHIITEYSSASALALAWRVFKLNLRLKKRIIFWSSELSLNIILLYLFLLSSYSSMVKLLSLVVFN